MINDRNHLFPLPLLWVEGTTLPLEAVGGRGCTRDELGVEAPAAPADEDESRSKVDCLLPVPTNPSPCPAVALSLRLGGGETRCTGR